MKDSEKSDITNNFNDENISINDTNKRYENRFNGYNKITRNDGKEHEIYIQSTEEILKTDIKNRGKNISPFYKGKITLKPFSKKIQIDLINYKGEEISCDYDCLEENKEANIIPNNSS